MRNIKQHGLPVLIAVVALWFAASAARAQDAAATNATTNESTTSSVASNTASTEQVTAPAKSAADSEDEGRVYRSDVVQIGHDAELRADEVAQDVVAVFGSTKVLGHARGDVVAVFGDVDLEGKADGAVVAVFGTLHAGSNAVVGGDAVSVGGAIEREHGAKFHGQVQETGINLPGFRHMTWVSTWFSECVLKLRPLAPRVAWVWPVAGVFFLVYLLIAAAFPQTVRPCVEALNTRPITTLAVGVLGKFALAIVYLLLVVTVIGIIIIPFVQVAMIVAFLVGKVAILERIGSGVGKAARVEPLQRPVLGFVLGAAIVTLIYTVPVLGLLTYLFISAWGSGAAVTAAFLHLRRERPPKTPISPATPSPTPPPTFTMPVAGAAMMAAAAAPINHGDPVAAPGGPAPLPETAAPPLVSPPLPSALAYPRGGFWVRMGAGFLDCVLILLVSVRGGPALCFLVAVAYFAGMLAWKGTTVGGIILRLQVVRANGQPLSFLVALVRALAAVFSGFVLFLGFFWIGWDSEKQGWHDKIAGTVVVRLPHAPALVCI